MTKVVFDTNVFLSALFWEGVPYQLFQKSLTGEISSFTSPQILQEIREKLAEKFKFPQEKVEEFLEIIVFNSNIVYPRKRVHAVAQDPSDNKIIECALEAKASFVISGDKHLLEVKQYKGIRIISPREFLSQLK